MARPPGTGPPSLRSSVVFLAMLAVASILYRFRGAPEWKAEISDAAPLPGTHVLAVAVLETQIRPPIGITRWLGGEPELLWNGASLWIGEADQRRISRSCRVRASSWQNWRTRAGVIGWRRGRVVLELSGELKPGVPRRNYRWFEITPAGEVSEVARRPDSLDVTPQRGGRSLFLATSAGTVAVATRPDSTPRPMFALEGSDLHPLR